MVRYADILDTGDRLPLGATVVLATYEAAVPQGKDRELCLVAVAPQRRRDGTTIRLETLTNDFLRYGIREGLVPQTED